MQSYIGGLGRRRYAVGGIRLGWHRGNEALCHTIVVTRANMGFTFLLLSMRGEDSGRGSRAARRGTAAAGKTAKAVPVAAAPVAKTAVAAKPVAPSKRFAADGGTPVPSAGFLGFGSRPASN